MLNILLLHRIAQCITSTAILPTARSFRGTFMLQAAASPMQGKRRSGPVSLALHGQKEI
jgi:hypothetical protein